MFQSLLNRLFGNRNQRVLRRLTKTVLRINALEPELNGAPEDVLRQKSEALKARARGGEALEKLLPEAFALVREAGRRTLGLCHFDVQLAGGVILHEGKIAEMQTGEGKTLVATLSAYLNALTDKGVHIVTVNDYLARRDANWMGPIYDFLGLSVGVIVNGLSSPERKEAYSKDIVYGTNNEFGFDYLRDNMAFDLNEKVQRDLHYAIVDEVDSILIDEARTPLIISGQAEDSTALYLKVNALIPQFTKQEAEGLPGDYSVDEKAKQVFLTEQGNESAERILVTAGLLSSDESLYSANNMGLLHHLYAALRAHVLFKKDVDYIVRDGGIMIIDEHTGRMMPGRRWSEGLHQAVEAKEAVPIQSESQTLASITFQNYFRLYQKLAGMTGTADTEAFEFQKIYGLEVVVVPPNKPNQRKDGSDVVYLTAQEKFNAVVQDIETRCAKGQPLLVGTASIETSEHLSALLQKKQIEHQVLNAKQHEKEAHIIAQAGRPSTVTIATNMAGRGTDIVLGGNLEAELKGLSDATPEKIEEVKKNWQTRHELVVSVGGLHVIGTERHESRRIDNQLRGRSARQGDPGSSQFYLSLEDNLIRIFASNRMAVWMQKFGMKENEAITHPWLTRAIENAQRKVEERNFDIRKQLLEYDDVANLQRRAIYEQRNALMATEDIHEAIDSLFAEITQKIIAEHIPPQSLEEQWNIPGLTERLKQDLGLVLPIASWLEQDETLHEETLVSRLIETVKTHYHEKETLTEPVILRHFEKAVMLQSLDRHWREHLAAMDYLRQGIHLRGYAQKQPMQEYKREAFNLFSQMLDSMKAEVVSILSRVQVREQEDVDKVELERRKRAAQQVEYHHNPALEEASKTPEEPEQARPYVRGHRKIGRNEPCPCGSGRKYKHCHGQLLVE